MEIIYELNINEPLCASQFSSTLFHYILSFGKIGMSLKNFYVIFFFCIILTTNSKYFNSHESKIPKIIYEVINEVLKNSEISTVAILTGKSDFFFFFQTELHHCLPKEILQLVMNLTKIPNNAYLPDSTIYVLVTDEIDWVN